MEATQEEQVGAGAATQVGLLDEDNYDSSDNEQPPQKTLTSTLVEGFGDLDDDEDDDDYVEEKHRTKSKAKKRVVNDDDEDDEGGAEDRDQGMDNDGGEESSSEEESDSDSDADVGVPQKRRQPSARREAKNAKEVEQARKAKAEAKKRKNEEVQPSFFAQSVAAMKKTKKKDMTTEEKHAVVSKTLEIMKKAFERDNLNRRSGRPALEKLEKLDEVMDKLTDQQLVGTFVEQGVGYYLVDWLRPGRKDLPNIKLRSKLFKAIDKLPFADQETKIKETQIGKILNFYRCHPDETLENKRLTNSIISRWMDVLTKS